MPLARTSTSLAILESPRLAFEQIQVNREAGFLLDQKLDDLSDIAATLTYNRKANVYAVSMELLNTGG